MCAFRTLLPRRVRNNVRVGDGFVAGETIRHGVALVDRLPDFLDLNLQLSDAGGEIVDGVHMLSLAVRLVGLVRLASGPLRKGLVRVFEIFSQDGL